MVYITDDESSTCFFVDSPQRFNHILYVHCIVVNELYISLYNSVKGHQFDHLENESA